MVKLSKEQADRRSKLVELGEEVINPAAQKRDKEHLFDMALWQECSKLNLHGIFIDKTYNGLELSLVDGMSMLESMGFAFRDNGLSFSITAQLLSCSIPINKYGTENQKRDYLPSIIKGQSIFAHAITENQSGSDAFNMSANYTMNENDTFKVSGSKTYISNLPVADFLVCYLKDHNSDSQSNISAFLIPKEHLTEVKDIDKMGLNSCKMGSTFFESTLERTLLLGNIGNGKTIFNESMTMERLGMSALHLGTIERLLQECIQWSKKRTSNNRVLGDYQSISHTLVNIYNNWTVLRSHLYHLCQQKPSFAKLFLQAAILNDKVSELYVESCKDILQIYGGLGYTQSHEIERMMRDALASKIYSGTSRIQKEIVWKFIS